MVMLRHNKQIFYFRFTLRIILVQYVKNFTNREKHCRIHVHQSHIGMNIKGLLG